MFTRNGLHRITVVIKNYNGFIKLTKLYEKVESSVRILKSLKMDPLCKMCLYSEFSQSVFSRIRTKYGEIQVSLCVFSVNAGKYGPGKLRIQTLFKQFHVTGLFLLSLKPCFQGVQKDTCDMKWVKNYWKYLKLQNVTKK